MGRGVMTASGSVEVVYLHVADDEQWDDLKMCVQGILQDRYPSFQAPSNARWIGRECFVLLGNDHADVTISEYCGCVAVCLAVSDTAGYGWESSENLHRAWCQQISKGFREALHKAFLDTALTHIATGSDGIPFYCRIKPRQT